MITNLEGEVILRGDFATAGSFKLAKVVVVVTHSLRKNILDLFPVGIRQVDVWVLGTQIDSSSKHTYICSKFHGGTVKTPNFW
jgi:hypothetical protein